MIKQIKIHLLKSKSVPEAIIDHCIKTLALYPTFHIEKINVKPIDLENNFEWSVCFKKIEEIRITKKIENEDFLVLLTDKKNINNWFSAFNQEANFRHIFIQTTDWLNYLYTNDKNLIIYQIIENVLQAVMYEFTEKSMRWIHKYPIGCMNDFCDWKPDVQFKLKTADICKDCLDILEDCVSTDVLKDCIVVLDEIRKNVISSSKYYDPPDYEANFFSPIALTKRKISSNSDPLRKTLFAIDHFDLLIKTHIYLSLALNCNSNSISSFLEKLSLEKKPSLGHWVNSLSSIHEYIDKDSSKTNFQKNINELTKRVLSIAQEINFVKIRNEERGHGYINSHDSKYSNIYNKLNPSLNSIEEIIIKAFSKYLLIRALKCSKKGTEEYEISYNNLVGSNMLLEEKIKTIEFNPDFIDGQIYIVSRDFKIWKNLYPYLVLDECPECHHQRLMIKDGQKYIDIYIGHRVDINKKTKTH